MVAVNLWSGLRRLTGGETRVEVQATTVRQMLDALVRAHPGLGPVIKAGVSVSIDGVIEPSLSAPVGPGSEVWLMQRIKGG
jgi:hypothetical protein